MWYFVKRYTRQMFHCLAANVLFPGIIYALYKPIAGVPENLNDLDGILKSGLALSAVIYFIGVRLSAGILESRDAQLIPLTPLTPRLLFRQNCKYNLGYLLGFVMLNPILMLWLLNIRLAPKLSLMSTLAGINLTLGYLVLLLYPLHLAVSAHPWRWNPFFFARWVVLRLLALLFALPVRLLKTLSLAWLLALGAALYLFHMPLYLALLRVLAGLIDLGPLGQIAFFLLSPFSGLFLACQPGTPQALPLSLTAILCALLLCCLRSWIGIFNMPVNAMEKDATEWWLEHRTEVETAEEQAVTEMEAVTPTPWMGNSRQEGFIPTEADAALAAAEEAAGPIMVSGLESESQNLFPADDGLDYQPGLPAAAQIRRHARYWCPARDFFLLNPWFIGSVLVLAMAARLSGWAPRLSPLHPALLVVIIGAIPVVHLVQTSNVLGEFTVWTTLVPLRWPGLILANALAFRRTRLALDLGLLLVFYAVGDCPLVLLLSLPLLFILNRMLLGILYWFQARAQVAGWQSPFLILATPYLVCWFLATIGSAGMLQDKNDSAELILILMSGLAAATAVLLIAGVLLALLMRLKSDTQVVAPPDFKLVK